ncbi:TPA: hypothetical protein MW699_002458 [Acinetobacter baumannii]|uniref:hypothetical protein n=1 Tax=Acinetobacter baumannii TaxID=470 RepID=UPI001A91F089|nr:hypothetical protein [Acinetobacter baumannii]EKU9950474.1 hypothetical protein [Acinetobacter baumannii]EKX3721495.1 hypothetical protein [Acinetobacter baumannii]EKX3752336.1 hypothetical protein [Acinetobacter baumannii]MBO0633212.1 hypothetical protein [Acinetobacter baumannii]MDH2488098.1 hypothetical protein [Acinetobacter baumannii]
MKINIPDQQIALTCPNCESNLLSIDENEIVTCGTCDLKLHKHELIDQNNIVEKIDTKQIAEDVAKEMKKFFKSKGWK